MPKSATTESSPPPSTTPATPAEPKAPTGWARLSPEQRREMSARGGRAAHASGKAHVFNSETASEAGKKGSAAAWAKGVAHRFTPEEAREAGLKGGVVEGLRRDCAELEKA